MEFRIGFFELGSQKNMNVPKWIIISLQQPDRQVTQSLNYDSFCGLPVTSAQCIIGRERYPDAAILLSYADHDYSQCYSQNKEAFRAYKKDDNLQPYISD